MGDGKDPVWHRGVISTSASSALGDLCEKKQLDRFYLAGGTGLALQFGHRLSRDLDFFSTEQFDEEILIASVQQLPGFSLISKAPYTLHATIQSTKVSFLGYPYAVLFPFHDFRTVRVADPRDIACMKISAIASRGAKRDFVDLYACARRYGLKEILQLFNRKFAQVKYNRIHILKSLTYFADAEKEPMPHMLEPLEWDAVKQFFLMEAPRLL